MKCKYLVLEILLLGVLNGTVFGMNQQNYPGYLDRNHEELAKNLANKHDKNRLWERNAALSAAIIKDHGLKNLTCDNHGHAHEYYDGDSYRHWKRADSCDCIDIFNAVQLVRFNPADAAILKNKTMLYPHDIARLSVNAKATLAQWLGKSISDLKEGVVIPKNYQNALHHTFKNGNNVVPSALPSPEDIRLCDYNKALHEEQVRKIYQKNDRPFITYDGKYENEKMIVIVSARNNNEVIGVISGWDHLVRDREDAREGSHYPSSYEVFKKQYAQKGFFGALWDATRHKYAKIRNVYHIVIDQQYQNQGYEQKAMHQLFEKSYAEWVVRVEICDGNMMGEDRSNKFASVYKDMGFTCVGKRCYRAFKALDFQEEQEIEKSVQDWKDSQKEVEEIRAWIAHKGVQNLYVNGDYPQCIMVGSDEQSIDYPDEPFYSWWASVYKKKHEIRQHIADTDQKLDRLMRIYLRREGSIQRDDVVINNNPKHLSKNNCEDMPRTLLKRLEEAKLIDPLSNRKKITPSECDLLIHLEAWGNIQRNAHLIQKIRKKSSVSAYSRWLSYREREEKGAIKKNRAALQAWIEDRNWSM